MTPYDANIAEQSRLVYDGSDYYLTVTLRRSGRIIIDVIPRVTQPDQLMEDVQAEVYRTVVGKLRELI